MGHFKKCPISLRLFCSNYGDGAFGYDDAHDATFNLKPFKYADIRSTFLISGFWPTGYLTK